MKKLYAALCLVMLASIAVSQTTLPIATNIKTAFDKNTRSTTGMPGTKYWQNNAVYDISIGFDPATRIVSGVENIYYNNMSPDTLKDVVFKLYPNLYKKGSPRLMKIDDADANDGMKIEEMTVNEEAQDVAKLRIDGTNMTVRVKPAKHLDQLHFKVSFSYVLNKGSHIRTGQVDDGAFFLAYFFPRIAVYDDIDGWNRNQYLGTQEFYNDFCDFNVKVTLPGNYLAWGTGDLTNCSDVLNAKYCDRIKQAETNDGFVDIIDSTDLRNGNITKNSTKNTWVFNAKNVTDIALAFSDHYLWQSSSVLVDSATRRRTRVDAVFNKEHKDYFNVVSDARATVYAMSHRFPKWPYPYNHETVFDGLDQMEYPMMVNDNPVEDRSESIELTDHEIFHTMFPFYMGINETKYGWMDEGWATIGEWLISPMIDTTIVDLYGMANYERSAGTESDAPITTLTTQENGLSMFLNSYPKPAMGYLFVKDMLGDELFFKALHNYIRNWNGKHPIPQDFFNSMNEGSGKDLNWFWKRWFYEDGVPDLAIKTLSGSGPRRQIIIESIGSKPLPIDLTIKYKDGTEETIHRSIAVWEKGNKTVAIPVASSRPYSKITLGSAHVPDSNKKDNEVMMK